MKPDTIIYSIGKVLSTKLGMGIFSSTGFFGLLLLVSGISDKSSIIVVAIGSIIFGVFFSISMHKKMEPMLVGDMNRNRYDTQRKFSQLYKREEIPTSKVERKQYLEYLEKLEKMMHSALGRKNTIWLLCIVLMAGQIILFSKGMSWLKLMAIFVLMVFPLSYYSTRKQYQKIQRIKSWLREA